MSQLMTRVTRVTCLYEQMQQAQVVKRDAEQKKNLAEQQYEDALVRWQEEQANFGQMMHAWREAGVPTDEAVDADESHEVQDDDDGYMSDDVDAAAPTVAAAVTDLTGPAAPTGGSSSD